MKKPPEKHAVGPVRLRTVKGPRADGRWYWRAERYGGGKAAKVWSGWATTEEADRAVMERCVGVVPDGGTTGTIRDLLAYYVGRQEDRADIRETTAANLARVANRINLTLGSYLVDRFTSEELERYAGARVKAGGAPFTVRGEIDLLVAAWRWGRRCGRAPDRDLARAKVRREWRRPRYEPTPEEVVLVLSLLRPWAAMLIRVFHATGARLGEIDSLLWGAVDLDGLTIRVTGKTGPRAIPIGEQLAIHLRRWRGDLPVSADAPVWPVQASSIRTNLYTQLHEACDGAGLPRWTPQSLRRAATDAIYDADLGPDVEAALLGHTPAIAQAHYRTVRDKKLREAVERAKLGELPEATVRPFPGRR